jgi:hypothetical protein
MESRRGRVIKEGRQEEGGKQEGKQAQEPSWRVVVVGGMVSVAEWRVYRLRRRCRCRCRCRVALYVLMVSDMRCRCVLDSIKLPNAVSLY